MLNIVCYDVERELDLQELTGEVLTIYVEKIDKFTDKNFQSTLFMNDFQTLLKPSIPGSLPDFK